MLNLYFDIGYSSNFKIFSYVFKYIEIIVDTNIDENRVTLIWHSWKSFGWQFEQGGMRFIYLFIECCKRLLLG